MGCTSCISGRIQAARALGAALFVAPLTAAARSDRLMGGLTPVRGGRGMTAILGVLVWTCLAGAADPGLVGC